MSLPELYSALADPTRLRVLEMLHQKARPVHELAAAFAISRPAISRHLRVLKEAGLVKEVKQGRENLYSFQREPLLAGAGWIEKHGSKPKAKAGRPAVAEVVPVAAVAPKAEAATKAVTAPKVERTPKAAPAKTPRARPAMASPVPAAAPQLSFFDL